MDDGPYTTGLPREGRTHSIMWSQDGSQQLQATHYSIGSAPNGGRSRTRGWFSISFSHWVFLWFSQSPESECWVWKAISNSPTRGCTFVLFVLMPASSTRAGCYGHQMSVMRFEYCVYSRSVNGRSLSIERERERTVTRTMWDVDWFELISLWINRRSGTSSLAFKRSTTVLFIRLFQINCWHQLFDT